MTTAGVRVWGFAATSFAAVIVVYTLGSRDFGFGVDAGWHYAFAEELIRGHRWPISNETFFSAGMTDYPPAGHLLAVGIGALVGSTLHGIFIVTGLAFTAIYLALAEIVKRRDALSTIAILAVFVLILVITKKFRAYFGNEVIDEFFFAQLVGTGALLVAFLIVARLRGGLLVWLLSSASAAHLIAWFYPLSAIQFAFAATALQALQIFDRPWQWWLISVRTLSTVGVLGIVVVIHPAFFGMIKNALNDGGIVFPIISIFLMIACMLIGILLLAWLRRSSGFLLTDALMALATGICTMALAQAVAYYALGLGSPYAIKKHGFALGTVGALVAASLIVELPMIRAALERRRVQWLAGLRVFAGPVFLLLVLAAIFTGRKNVPVDTMVDFDRELRTFMDSPDAPPLIGATLLANAALPAASQNFTVALARLRPAPAVLIEQSQLLIQAPEAPKAAQFVLVARDPAPEPGCLVGAARSFVVIHVRCFTPIGAR